jgi:glutathione S-transferase
MAILHSYPFCPQSRFARLSLAETGFAVDLAEEKPWDRRIPFLEANPAGNLPLLVDDSGLAVPGARGIADYLDDVQGEGLRDRRLLPQELPLRVEVRRLLDWFLVKFHEEVSGYLATEKIYKRFMPIELWLAGDQMTYADLAAAAHLSVVDYLGDVPWDEDETAKLWYARVKSRPSFRALLADRVPGMAPADQYDNLDF